MAFTYLKVKSAKCLFTSGGLGLGLGLASSGLSLKNLALFTSLPEGFQNSVCGPWPKKN